MSARDRDRDAQLRAERIRWRRRSRRMNEQASLPDKRLRRHAEKTEGWHRIWDDPP